MNQPRLPVLFFLHLPKCAGMSLSDALLDRLGAGEVYQSTSMIRNFRENRPEFLEMGSHTRLQAVVGHWVHEAMLPLLRRPIYFATSLRDPVSRTRSQYRFDVGLRGGDWPSVSEQVFLEQNRNVMSTFLLRAFPTIARDFTSPLEACKTIISGFDCVFDIRDADTEIQRLTVLVGGPDTPVPRSNESTKVEASLSASDEEIREYQDIDGPLFEWFKETDTKHKNSFNKTFRPANRNRLASLVDGSADIEKIRDFLSEKYALELFYGTKAPSETQAILGNRVKFLQDVQQHMSVLAKDS